MIGETQQLSHDNRTLVRRVNPDKVPGFFTKRLRVAPGQWAIALYGDRVTVLNTGTPAIGGILKPTPRDVVLIEADTFTLHPIVRELMSGDEQLVEADFLVQVNVTNPQALYHFLGDEKNLLTIGDLEGWVAMEVRRLLARVARQYTANDLCYVEAVAKRVAGELRSFLQTYLAPMGLEVAGLHHVTFWRPEDAAKVAELMRRLRERLRDTTLREQFKAIQDVEEFRDALEQVLHERQLRQWLREEELQKVMTDIQEELEQESTQGKKQSDGKTIPLAWAVEERDAAQQRQIMGRWDALLARLGVMKKEECEPSPVDKLDRWVTILRALGTIVFFGTTLLAILMPDLFENPETPRLLTAAIGFFLGILAFISAFWIKRKAKARRILEQEEKALSRLSPERRRAVEQSVRNRIVAVLEQTVSNLQEAWTKAYRRERQDLAKPLRDMARKADRLREDVKASSYAGAILLTARHVEPIDIQPWLDIDENLLVQAEELGELSKGIYENVVMGQWEAVEQTMTQVDLTLQELQSRFAQRDILLKGA